MVESGARLEKLGPYRIRGKIGQGGMATVYVGKSDAGELVALKVIKAELTQHKDFHTMFMDEAKIALRLHHDNIVRIDALESDGDRLYMVMDLVRGQSLYNVWDTGKKRQERLSPIVVAYIGASIAAALHHAHEAKDENDDPLEIVHRDVNPSNVIVSWDGDVKVIDFGLAKAVNRMSHTAAGVVKGKISYLSPEQVTGKPLDRRADIFSLGTTLWELSVNRRLFKSNSKIDTVQMIHEAVIPDPLTIDAEYPMILWKIIRRALMKDRADRYQNARELEEELREFIRITAPNADPRAELARTMETWLGDERKKQEAWLRGASDDRKPLPTLMPPAATPSNVPRRSSRPPARANGKSAKEAPAPIEEGPRRVPVWMWLLVIAIVGLSVTGVFLARR